MPPRKSKTPEQLHEEELDKMTCPPVSYLINVEKKDKDGNRIEMSSWRYVDLANALNAYGKLLSLLGDEAITTKGGETSSGTIELSRCDREKKPTEYLLITYVKGVAKMTINNGSGMIIKEVGINYR